MTRQSGFLQPALAALALMAWAVQAHAQEADKGWADPTVVMTDRGAVGGTVGNGVREFKGIPYAAPPVGNLRWEPPQPAAAWSGVYDATQYRSACPQLERYGISESSYNEDCLYLNVTTPFPRGRPVGGKLPVIVWIHGGAFVGGSSGLYDLREFARRGIVVVSMNYRLGVFGFMPHKRFEPRFNGGYALEDQRAALRWVQDNIESFGGDKRKVTIAGESAGAFGVCAHLVTPERTSHLFHRAIIQSAGCTFELRHVSENQRLIGERVSAIVGCNGEEGELECLRKKSVKELLDASQWISNSDLMGFAPSYGTEALPRQGDDALARGQFVWVPILNGGNRDELRLYVAYDLIYGDLTTRDNFEEKIKATYGDQATAVLGKYPLRKDLSAAALLGTTWTDFHPDYGLNVCLFLRTAQLASKFTQVYQYEFADRDAPSVLTKSLPDPGIDMGAVHTAELPYQFPGFSNTLERDLPPLKVPQKQLANVMMEYWTSFAGTGSPSSTESKRVWKSFEKDGDVLWLEPGNIHNFSVDKEHHCDFWRRLYPRVLGQ